MAGEQETDVLVEDDEGLNEDKYLLFKLHDEIYGINIADVTEIIEMQEITDIPDMPLFVKGVINLRGNVIPIMDLRLRFSMEERDHDDRTCIIIAKTENRSFGLIVDTVTEVEDIPQDKISPPPKFKTDKIEEHYISGLGKVGEQVLILLDVHQILQDEEIQELDKVQKIEL